MTRNEQKIKVLFVVRRDIEQRRRHFICHSLDDFRGELQPAAEDLKGYILDQLAPGINGTRSLWNWLISEGHVTQDEYRKSQPRQRITRLAWIDWMIEQLEKP